MLSETDARLFDDIIEFSCTQAKHMLEQYDDTGPTIERRISDLEISPLLDKQLIAAALRLADDLCLSGGVRTSLLRRFQSPPPGVAVDALRRAIEREVRDKGLPMELARDYTDTLQRRISVLEEDLPGALWGHAAIYEMMWCDPRIGAPAPTRRIMLAMGTVLRTRSAQLTAAKNLNKSNTRNVASSIHPPIFQ